MSKLDTLEPDFREHVEQLIIAASNVTGRKWVITSGRRTMEEQRGLFAQGRSTTGKIVTNAPAGSSAHNFGYAADLAPMSADGKSIDWNAPKSMWKLMADIAVEMGLTAGFYFKSMKGGDAPHVEDGRWRDLQALWKAGKLEIS